jgi:hypothetical protein
MIGNKVRAIVRAVILLGQAKALGFSGVWEITGG